MKLKKKKGSEPQVEERLPASFNKPEIPTRKHRDLKDIMDYNREFSIFYSGVEYQRYLDACYEEGVRNFLMSFEYIENKDSSIVEYWRSLGVKFFIDSGAFTYMADPKYSGRPVEYWEHHIKRYLKWARANSDIIFAIANLDLEYLVGTDKVWEWNKKYFEPFMIETGIPVCFIWHDISGIEHWERMCERYPYVGFSAASEGDSLKVDMSDTLNKLSIAEEYGALVHGMGMTKTQELVKLPFYTVDSTTWKSCLRYGMYVTWTGTAVRQFPKDNWEDKVVPYMKLYERQFDMDALYNYEESEVIKASVYSFTLAEANIREHHRGLSYWLKPELKRQRLDASLFPLQDWFYNATYPGIEEYALKLNINPELRRLIDYITDCTIICMWDNEDYTQLKETVMKQVDGYVADCYDKYINKVCFDESEMLAELMDFFNRVVRGEEDKLLLMDTPFSRIRKERKFYTATGDSRVEELTGEEVAEKVKETGLLPASKDDEAIYSEELDAELTKATGIVFERDEQGRFTGGKLTKALPKSLVRNTPKIMCDNCIERNSCPEYKRGYVCAFHEIFSKFDTRNPADVSDALYEIANTSVSRLQRALVHENMDGGMITSSVTNLINQTLNILKDLKRMESDGALEVLKRTTIAYPDGRIEETQSIENPQEGGILAKIFAQPSPVRPDTEKSDETDGGIETVDVVDVDTDI